MRSVLNQSTATNLISLLSLINTAYTVRDTHVLRLYSLILSIYLGFYFMIGNKLAFSVE